MSDLNREQFLEVCGRLFDAASEMAERNARHREICQREVAAQGEVSRKLRADGIHPERDWAKFCAAYMAAKTEWSAANLTPADVLLKAEFVEAEVRLGDAAEELDEFMGGGFVEEAFSQAKAIRLGQY